MMKGPGRTILLLTLMSLAQVWAQTDSAIALVSGTAVADYADAALQPKRYFSIHLERGRELDAKVTTAYSKRDRLKIYLYAQSPNGLELLAQATPQDDGLGGPRTATLHWTIAVETDYYLLVWMEQGSASFTVSPTVTGSPAGPLPSAGNCLDGNVDEVSLQPNGEVDSVVIAGTKVGSATAISLPTGAVLRTLFPLGEHIRACYQPGGRIAKISLVR